MTDENKMTVGGYAPPPGPYGQFQMPQFMAEAPQSSNASPSCPPGLEYLHQIDQLIIKQKKELVEVVFNFHMRNKYEIRNSLGQHLWTAKEQSDCCARLCFRKYRPLTLSVKDPLENNPLFLIRPFRLPMGLCCWCNLCLAEMEVQGHGGIVLGFVRQLWHPFLPRFTVQTQDGQDALFIHGPFCVCSCGSDVKFKVLDVSGNSIGLICKRWGGCCKEWITAADNFTVQFPMDLDVKLKASLLAAALLLDYIHFENVDK